MHRAGLVHRDFKPANVLVTADGPRVIDFGLARSDGLPQGTAAGMVMGTPLYMAPEQAMGDRVVGPPADVFALGATLYHAATGAALYQEEKAVGVLLQKMRQPADLTGVPRELRGLIAGCLSLDPDDRPMPASLIAALAPHLAAADTVQPLPEAVLAYIEDYRVAEMELTRSRRAKADTAVLGEPTHVAAREGDFGDSGDGTVDPRPRHPSFPPDDAPSSRATVHRRRSRPRWWQRDPSGGARRWRRSWSRSASCSRSAWRRSAVCCWSGRCGTGQRGLDAPAAGAPSGAAAATTGGSSPRARRRRPTRRRPRPTPVRLRPGPATVRRRRVRRGGMAAPSPPAGAVTEVGGVRLGVRPPFGDPLTTYILNGNGWPAGQTVTVTFLNDSSVPPVKTVVDGNGEFSVALDQGTGAVALPDGRFHVRASAGSRSAMVSFVVGPPLSS